MRLCLCRPPRPEQVEPLVALYSAERERYREDRDGRHGAGHRADRPAPAGMDAAELAAWTAVANVLLNLDGVLTKG